MLTSLISGHMNVFFLVTSPLTKAINAFLLMVESISPKMSFSMSLGFPIKMCSLQAHLKQTKPQTHL